MHRVRKISFISCLILMTLTTSGYSLTSQSADINAGKRLYDDYCANCHGEEGIGQDPKKRNGGRDANGVLIAPALNGTAHTWHHPPKLLFRYIDKGSIVKSSPMPSFGKELGREEILSIIAYFQSLWPEPIRKHYFKKFK